MEGFERAKKFLSYFEKYIIHTVVASNLYINKSIHDSRSTRSFLAAFLLLPSEIDLSISFFRLFCTHVTVQYTRACIHRAARELPTHTPNSRACINQKNLTRLAERREFFSCGPPLCALRIIDAKRFTFCQHSESL